MRLRLFDGLAGQNAVKVTYSSELSDNYKAPLSHKKCKEGRLQKDLLDHNNSETMAYEQERRKSFAGGWRKNWTSQMWSFSVILAMGLSTTE